MRDSINRRDFLKRAGTAGLGLGLASQMGSVAYAAAPATKPLRRTVGPNDKLTALLDGNSYTIFDKNNKVVKEMKEKAAVDSTNILSGTGMALDQLHFENFVGAIRTGARLNSPIEEGHKSVTMLHLGNIACRVGRELHCDPANGQILKDSQASKLWRWEYERGWAPVV